MSAAGASGSTGHRTLGDRIVGISISDSEDLRRRGFLPIHIDHAMAEIATQAAAAGARIGYGGDLRPNGFTLKLFRTIAELYGTRRIATEEPPFIHYLAYPIWRSWEPKRLIEHLRMLSGAGEVVLVRPEGVALSAVVRDDTEEANKPFFEVARRVPRMKAIDVGAARFERLTAAFGGEVEFTMPIDGSVDEHMANLLPSDGRLTSADEAPIAEIFQSWQAGEAVAPAAAFSALRMFMAADEDARVILGGKTRDYSGQFPGIAEEALYSLAAGNPVIALSAFGGCAEDVATALLRGAAPTRDDAGHRYHEIMRGLAAGAPVFREVLNMTERGEEYARVSRLDSGRPLAIGILRLLESTQFAGAWESSADQFVASVTPEFG